MKYKLCYCQKFFLENCGRINQNTSLWESIEHIILSNRKGDYSNSFGGQPDHDDYIYKRDDIVKGITQF